MRVMEKINVFYLTLDIRRKIKELRAFGYRIGSSNERTLIQIMDISAIYPKPRIKVTDKTKNK